METEKLKKILETLAILMPNISGEILRELLQDIKNLE